MRIVVDASVAVKWFVEGEGSARASRLLEHRLDRDGRSGLFEPVAPELLLLEVVAVMARRARFGSVRPDYPTQVLQALRRLRLGLTPDAELLDHATRLSVTLRHPVYDCLYLAFSRRFSAHLATFDKGLGGIARHDGLLWESP